jgi:predicted dehydrogenase
MQKAAVIGVGSLGRHHARIYNELEGVELVAVCDTDEARAREYAEQYGCRAVADYRDLLGAVDAASVAAPTVDHARIGCDLLASGVATLIEKPIAASLEEADRVVAAARAAGAVLQIGHVERFNPAVRAAAGVVTTPRFIECHRLAAFTPRSLDIDVVMDLMIHDIDVILSLVDSEVAEIHAAGIGILTEKVDIANARIEFENGCIANVTASRVSSERVRKIRLFQPSDYVSIDYAGREVSVVSLVPPKPGDERPQIAGRKVEVEDVEPLKAELEAFLAAARGEQPPTVSGEDGRRALDVATRVLTSIRRHAEKVGIAHES